MTSVEKFRKFIDDSQRIVGFTGAGVSTESGIADYRSQGGIWEKFQPVYFDEFKKDEEKRKLYWQRKAAMWQSLKEALPGPAHTFFTQLYAQRKLRGLITQNIDGLHQKAGNERVTELHGNLWQMACPRTVDYTEDDQFSDDAQDWMSSRNRESILRRWSQENNQTVWENREVPFSSIPPSRDPEVRPNILFFNEGYGTRLMWVEDFIQQAPDAVLIIGCSGGVSILDRLLRYCLDANPNCSIININAHEDCIDHPHLYIQLPAAIALKAFHC